MPRSRLRTHGFRGSKRDRADDVAEIRDVISRSAALRAAGQYRRAEELVADQKARVELIGFPPLSQDYALERAVLASTLEELELEERLLLETYAGASRSKRTTVAVDAASRLAVALAERGENEAAQRWLRVAEEREEDLGDGLKAEILDRRGGVLAAVGDYNSAIAAYRRAVTTEERRSGTNAVALVAKLSHLGSAQHEAGRYDEAEASLERALALARSLGESHPMVADVLHNRFVLASPLGEVERGQAVAAEALPIYEATYGPRHPTTAMALTDAGVAAFDRARALAHSSCSGGPTRSTRPPMSATVSTAATHWA